MENIINCLEIRDNILKDINVSQGRNIFIQVGNRADSNIYIRNKEYEMFLHYPFEVLSLFLNYSRVAQSVERQAVNLMVAGSSPAAGAIAENRDKGSRGG